MMREPGRIVRLSGRLERADLGPGAWVLFADDGTRYSLDGPVPAHLAERRVTVRGTLHADLGFAMVGPVLRVEGIEPR